MNYDYINMNINIYTQNISKIKGCNSWKAPRSRKLSHVNNTGSSQDRWSHNIPYTFIYTEVNTNGESVREPVSWKWYNLSQGIEFEWGVHFARVRIYGRTLLCAIYRSVWSIYDAPWVYVCVCIYFHVYVSVHVFCFIHTYKMAGRWAYKHLCVSAFSRHYVFMNL